MVKNRGNKTTQDERKASETVLALVVSKTYTEAAEKLGIARKTLYRRIERYNLQELVDQVPQEAIAALKAGSLAAAMELIGELSEQRPEVRHKAAKEILDRAGVVKGEEGMHPLISLKKIAEEDREKYKSKSK